MGRDRHPHSHLFTIRLWQEVLREGRTEWRGQIKYVISGQTRYFRTWSDLLAHLQGILLDVELNQNDDSITDSSRYKD